MSALWGLAWFGLLGGLGTVIPTNVDWLGRGDLSSQFVSWLLLRNSDWHLPLGRIDGLLFPVGSSAALSDLIPLLSIPGRLLSPILPTDFQYIGAWLASCFALQGWFGARLTGRFTGHFTHRLAGGMLFVLAPPLLARATGLHTTHPSLCGQWLLVASLALALDPRNDAAVVRRSLGRAILIAALAVWIHAQLAVMVLAIALAMFVRHAVNRTLPLRTLALQAALLCGLTSAGLALLGYFSGGATAAFGGFGFFSADLLSLVNPMQFSRFLPPLPAGRGQFEGSAYLGLGALAMTVVSAALLVRSPSMFRSARANLPLMTVCVGLAIFSLTPHVTLAGEPVLVSAWLMAHMAWIGGIFRAPGRFVWPLHYLVISSCIAIVVTSWKSRPRLASSIMFAAVLLQIFDLSPACHSSTFEGRPWRLSAPQWWLAAGHYRHMALLPPQIPLPEVGADCNGRYAWSYWTPLAYQAYRLGATINSGFVARVDTQAVRRSCRQLAVEVATGKLRPDTLYVVHPDLQAAVEKSGLACARLEDHTACVSPSAQNPFRDFVVATRAQAGEPKLSE